MAKLPSVTSNIPRDLRSFIDRVREAINGTGEDSLVTVRQLVASGIASANGSGGLSVPPAPAVTAVGAEVPLRKKLALPQRAQDVSW